MATIKFGDYLKTKKRKEAIYESDESLAKRARILIDQDVCAVQPQFRIENYQKAIALLEQIPEQPDTPGMMEECRAGIEDARKQIVLIGLEDGKYHLDMADTEHEFRKASDELEQVADNLRGIIASGETGSGVNSDNAGYADGQDGANSDDAGCADGQDGVNSDNAGCADGQDDVNSDDAGRVDGQDGANEGSPEADSRDMDVRKAEDRDTDVRKAASREADGRYTNARYDEMLRETEKLKARADAEAARCARATTRHRIIALLVVLLIVAAGTFAWTGGYVGYIIARLEGVAGMYESAYSRFEKMGDFLDSRSQYEKYLAEYLRQKEEEADNNLRKAKTGDSVSFANFTWKVLEKEGTTLRLICLNPAQDSAFRNLSYDGEQPVLQKESETGTEESSSDASQAGTAAEESSSDVSQAGIAAEESSGDASQAGTAAEESSSDASQASSASWATSSLRAYLNGMVLEEVFTPDERNALVIQYSGPTSNEEYGTSIDESMQDRVTILSAEEARYFQEEGVFSKPSVDMWLRTPGHDMQSAAYMTSSGTIILFGDDTSDSGLSACPVIAVDYAKLENEES